MAIFVGICPTILGAEGSLIAKPDEIFNLLVDN
jgi:hypothetical protein